MIISFEIASMCVLCVALFCRISVLTLLAKGVFVLWLRSSSSIRPLEKKGVFCGLLGCAFGMFGGEK